VIETVAIVVDEPAGHAPERATAGP
jgi:hypothetical protein